MPTQRSSHRSSRGKKLSTVRDKNRKFKDTQNYTRTHRADDVRPSRGQMANPTLRYKVAIKSTPEGIAVWVPGLPGCWSQGDSEREALENISFAIREYLEVATELLGKHDVREVEVAT